MIPMTNQEPAIPRQGVPFDTFGLRLRIARAHVGDMSIEAAAAACGVKPATWSTWERGVHKPPHLEAIVKAIASGLDVDEDWLLNGGPLAPDPGPGTPPALVTLSERASSSGRRKSATRGNSVYCSDSQANILSNRTAA